MGSRGNGAIRVNAELRWNSLGFVANFEFLNLHGHVSSFVQESKDIDSFIFKSFSSCPICSSRRRQNVCSRPFVKNRKIVTRVAVCSYSGANLSLEFLFLPYCMHKARALFQSCVNEVSRDDSVPLT